MKGIFVKVMGAVVAMVGLAAQAGTITYYHNDLLGSPVVATDASGAVIWRESYWPYGERLTNAAASSTNDVWFTGRRQDVDTGLVYMGARYYDPALGRFISTDPKGFDEESVHSFNRYAYANNNPYKFRDPDGKAAIFVAAEGALLIGGIAFVSQPREVQERQLKSLMQGVQSLLSWASSNDENGKDGQSEAGGEGKSKPDDRKDSATKGKEKDVPDRGEPGEVREGQRRTREYGPDGKPVRDYDKPHQGHERPHVHE